MPQELIVHNWCDVCFVEKRQTEGTTTESISLGRGALKTLLLCEEHRAQILDPIHELLRKFGQTVEKPVSRPKSKSEPEPEPEPEPSPPALESKPGGKANGRKLTCPVKDCSTKGTKSSLKHHVTAVHGLTLPQAAYLKGRTLEGKAIKFVCSEGPCEESHSGFAVKTALVQHLTRIHDHAPGMDVTPYAA
jgi:hypothetical protein